MARAEEHPKPGTAAFLKHVWRHKPAVYRRFFLDAVLRPFRGDTFSSLCKPPATARIFVAADDRGHGVSRLIPDPMKAWAIFQTFRHSEPLTLLLNSVERVDPRLRDLQRMFAIPFDWRADDVVATISTPRAGIGYHAGREDGFVVQVSGSRRWRVWAGTVVKKP